MPVNVRAMVAQYQKPNANTPRSSTRSNERTAATPWAGRVHDLAAKFKQISANTSNQTHKAVKLGENSMRDVTVVTSCNDRWNVDANAFAGPDAISDASQYVRMLNDEYWTPQWGVMSTIIRKEWCGDGKIVFLQVNSRAKDNPKRYPYISLYVISTAYVDPLDNLVGVKFCGSTNIIVRYGGNRSFELLEWEILKILYPRWIRVAALATLEPRSFLGQQRLKDGTKKS
jgi:hypothetical protein